MKIMNCSKAKIAVVASVIDGIQSATVESDPVVDSLGQTTYATSVTYEADE
jgi:hypothetical protein